MTGERDFREPAFDAAWRAQSRETPPAALDAAILAAAHRAVQSAPAAVDGARSGVASRSFRIAGPLLAAAAIGVVAVGVLQLAPPPAPEPSKVVVSDTPASMAPAPPAAGTPAVPALPAPAIPAPAPSTAPAPIAGVVPAPARAPMPPQETRARAAAAASAAKRSTEAIVPQVAPPGALDALRPRYDEKSALPRAEPVARPEAVQRRADAKVAAPQPFPAQDAVTNATNAGIAEASRADVAPAPPAAASPPTVASSTATAPAPAAARGALSARDAPREAVMPPRTPDAWIAELRRLHDAHDDAAAARALGDFRAAYPDADARLPDDLRAWAASVPARR